MTATSQALPKGLNFTETLRLSTGLYMSWFSITEATCFFKKGPSKKMSPLASGIHQLEAISTPERMHLRLHGGRWKRNLALKAVSFASCMATFSQTNRNRNL